MALIDEIREQYPNPIQAGPNVSPSDGYCVGGAICMFAREHRSLNYAPKSLGARHFPSQYMVAIALQKLNLALPEDLADFWAGWIVEHNDNERFDRAWGVADEALQYEPKEEV